MLPVDVVVGQPLILVRELSGKILGHAAHPDRPDALNARALNGVECVPRGALIRCERRMQFGIVSRDHEGDRVGVPADDRHFLTRHETAGLREPRGFAVEAGRVGAERNIHGFVRGQRARRERHCAFERRQWIGPFLYAIRHR